SAESRRPAPDSRFAKAVRQTRRPNRNSQQIQSPNSKQSAWFKRSNRVARLWQPCKALWAWFRTAARLAQPCHTGCFVSEFGIRVCCLYACASDSSDAKFVAFSTDNRSRRNGRLLAD